MPFQFVVLGVGLFLVLSVIAALRRSYGLFLKATAGVGLEYAFLGTLFGDLVPSGIGAVLFFVCLVLIRREHRRPDFHWRISKKASLRDVQRTP
jgi:hypothetical protein